MYLENSGALVPIADRTVDVSSLWCPMCRRPFVHHNGDDDEDEEGATHGSTLGDYTAASGNASPGGHRGALVQAGGLLTSQYFRSLPPVQEDGTESPLPTTPVSQQRLPPCHDEESLSNEPSQSQPSAPAEEDKDEMCRRLAAMGYYALHFAEVHRIGGGTFGAVFLCRHVIEGETLGLFAVKKIPIGDDPAYFCKVLREVRVMEEIKRHPNVLEYHHSWIDYAKTADFGPYVRCLFVLMEFASVGSLEDYLRVHGSSLSNMAVWYFFLSAVAGIAHLHAKGILHRDVKPQNLLLTRSENSTAASHRNGSAPAPPPRLLVADFGTSALLADVSLADRTGGTGTQEYMAPELFDTASESGSRESSSSPCGSNASPNSPNASYPHEASRYLFATSKASDVWSLGMILHYLACDGTLPPALPDGSVILNVQEHSPVERPVEMVELIRAMLHRDPAMRPSCQDILAASSVQKILRSFEREDFAGHELRPSLRRMDSSVRGGTLAAATSTTALSRRTSPVPAHMRGVASQQHTPPASFSPTPVATSHVQVQTDVSAAEWAQFEQWRLRQDPA